MAGGRGAMRFLDSANRPLALLAKAGGVMRPIFAVACLVGQAVEHVRALCFEEHAVEQQHLALVRAAFYCLKFCKIAPLIREKRALIQEKNPIRINLYFI